MLVPDSAPDPRQRNLDVRPMAFLDRLEARIQLPCCIWLAQVEIKKVGRFGAHAQVRDVNARRCFLHAVNAMTETSDGRNRSVPGVLFDQSRATVMFGPVY